MSAEQLAVEEAELGTAILTHLEWDTQFFGKRIGKITRVDVAPNAPDTTAAVATLLEQLLDYARAEGYAYVTYRLPAGDLAKIWGAESVGLRLVDEIVDHTVTLTDPHRPRLTAKYPARIVSENDIPALQRIAGHAFTYTRFAVDPFFSADANRVFHEAWIANLVRGLAQAVLAVDVGGQTVGFVACAGDRSEGRIPLIGVDASTRGQGIGESLIASALDWFASAQFDHVHIRTQVTNTPALALYAKAGFRITSAEVTLSTVLEDTR